MKKIALLAFALPILAFPAVSSASSLTPAQANAIIGLLVAFNADPSVIERVRASLFPAVVFTPAPSDTMIPVPGALPSINNTTIPMEDKSAIIVSLAHKAPVDVAGDMPFGGYILKVQVLDSAGNPVNGAPVSMSTEGKPTVNKKVDTTTSLQSKDYYVQFEYIPTATGNASLQFTSGNLADTFVLNVE